MAPKKNKDRKEKQRIAREKNALEKTITPKKREHGKKLIVFLVSMTVIAAGFVLYIQH